MEYKHIITVLGDEKIMKALADRGTVKMTHMAVGDGNGAEYVPVKTMTMLKREKWRGAINKIISHPQDPRILIVTATIPSDVGNFDVRETAIFDSAGDMVTIGNYPSCYKPVPASGCSKDMTIEVWVIVADTSVINLTADLSVVQATLGDLDQLDEKYTVEVGSTMLTNTKEYPFNNSTKTLSLVTSRETLDYSVDVELLSSAGSVGQVEVFDKQLNGFKVRFTGSAKSASIKYYVRGGLIR